MSTAPAAASPSTLDAFHDACRRGNFANAHDLLNQNSSLLTAVGTLGNTALHWAASGGHLDIVQTLIQEKADVDAVNNDGETPLHLAAGKGKATVANLLANSGASRSARNKQDQTPDDLANDEVIKAMNTLSSSNLRAMVQRVEEDPDSD